MGATLLLDKSLGYNLVAIATPVILAGVEVVIVMTVLSNGSIDAKKSELILLLQVQAFFLLIVALILFTLMFIAWQYGKSPKNIEMEEYPLGEC